MTTDSDKKPEGQWAFIELFGHRQIVGTIEDTIRHGIPMVAIRTLSSNGTLGDPEYKAPAALYGDKPITQERARYLAGCTDKLLPAPQPAAAPGDERKPMTGIALIDAARGSQLLDGYDAQHDAEHTEGELARAAAVYAAPVSVFERGPAGELLEVWPWAPSADHRATLGRIEQLAQAGAFCAAEIDRLILEAQQQDEAGKPATACSSCDAPVGEPCKPDCTDPHA